MASALWLFGPGQQRSGQYQPTRDVALVKYTNEHPFLSASHARSPPIAVADAHSPTCVFMPVRACARTRLCVRACVLCCPLSHANSEVLGGEPTSDRGLTVTELLVRVGHYSEQSRKDGLAGLRTLFTRHPSALEHTSTLMRLFEKVAPRIHDDAAAVRHEVICWAPCLVRSSPMSFFSGLSLSAIIIRRTVFCVELCGRWVTPTTIDHQADKLSSLASRVIARGQTHAGALGFV